MNRKGALTDLFIWAAIGLIAVVFFAAWIYGHNILTQKLQGIGTVGNTNVTDAANRTFVAVNNALPILRIIAFVILISMGVSILVSNYLIKVNPAFFIVYILIIVVAVIFSAYISNAYETLLTNGDVLSPELQKFTGANFIFLHLPIWTAAFGIFGAIFLFAGLLRDRDLGGGIY